MLKNKSDELASKRAEADQFKAQLDSANHKISALLQENAMVNTNLQQQSDTIEDLMKRMETLQTSVTGTKNLLSNVIDLLIF
jgi:predicted nuclease with TOPRIM domain